MFRKDLTVEEAASAIADIIDAGKELGRIEAMREHICVCSCGKRSNDMATETMTKSEAGRIGARKQADQDLMRNAARNLRFCELRASGMPNIQIAQEAGLSPSRTSRIISKGEDHWQMWLERAIEEGIEQEGVPGSVPEPDGAERVEMVDIRLIGENPFQPRRKFSTREVMDLGNDIFDNGQQIPITIRPSLHDTTVPYELCWGQLRLEAFRAAAQAEVEGAMRPTSVWFEHHDRDTGVTRIKAIVREMDDADLRMGALSENLNRNDMAWSDTIRALDDLCENTDYTAADVATIAKMSPQQLSNQRRLLRLPVEILDMVDDGVMAWTSARELLVFTTPHHTHQYELDYCVRRLKAKRKNGKDGLGNPIKRIDASSVRTIITNSLCHGSNVTGWEWLVDSRYLYMGDGNSHGKTRPKFDIEQFSKTYREWCHKIPRRYGGSQTEMMTCAVESWRDWQEAAEEEELRAEEEAAEEANRLGPVATAFSNENPRAERLPRHILHMLEDGRLSQTFVHRLLYGFVKESYAYHHSHQDYLEEICDGLRAISAESPSRVVQDAAAGGVVLKALRKKLGKVEFRSLDDRLTSFGFEPPRFAMDEFIESQQAMLHNVPIGIGIVRVTCSAEAWDAFQAERADAIKEQVARGNQPTEPDDTATVTATPAKEPAAQLMDMSMAETEPQAQVGATMVPMCFQSGGEWVDHWHVMTRVGAPGFADKAMRSHQIYEWDDVIEYLERLATDGGGVPWVEEHVYDDTV